MKKSLLFKATILLLPIALFILISDIYAANSSSASKLYYTCPMKEHADIVLDKPGKCPKCGMELVPTKSSAIQYVCPMKEDADIVSDKPGKCPKCGMKLVPKKRW